MFLSATEAAELLSISSQRMRYLLKKNRVQGARKIHRVWVVPTFEEGKPLNFCWQARPQSDVEK